MKTKWFNLKHFIITSRYYSGLYNVRKGIDAHLCLAMPHLSLNFPSTFPIFPVGISEVGKDHNSKCFFMIIIIIITSDGIRSRYWVAFWYLFLVRNLYRSIDRPKFRSDRKSRSSWIKHDRSLIFNDQRSRGLRTYDRKMIANDLIESRSEPRSKKWI